MPTAEWPCAARTAPIPSLPLLTETIELFGPLSPSCLLISTPRSHYRPHGGLTRKIAARRRGKQVVDKPLPNSEPKLRAVLDRLTAQYGKVLAVVDQPASIEALPLAVARDAGCEAAFPA